MSALDRSGIAASLRMRRHYRLAYRLSIGKIIRAELFLSGRKFSLHGEPIRTQKFTCVRAWEARPRGIRWKSGIFLEEPAHEQLGAKAHLVSQGYVDFFVTGF